ncbi:MAG: quinone-dependent dihydroorotate dehydrogenase [Planctomycetota bacterium]
MLYRALLRPILFSFDPESVHHLAVGSLRLASALPPVRGLLGAALDVRAPELEQEIWGLRFPHPVGLAAGFDKNAVAVPALMRMGFAFVEVGAVSSVPRPGNPRPRIFRLPGDRGLINRMGLPNDGVEAIAARLARGGPRPRPLFANIVKTADLEGSISDMAADFVTTLERILPVVDGFTVNVSCPASPNLKAFGRREAMFELLGRLREARDRGVAAGDGRFRPLILKVSPDVDDEESAAIVEAAGKGELDGLVLTNTTTQRPAGLAAPAEVLGERGGLSGAPLHAIALARVREFAAATEGRVPIIGVGGISGVDQSLAMLEAGASLVEVYTGFVYEGPSLPKRIARGLRDRGWRPTERSRTV